MITYSDLDTEQLSLVASGKYDITVKMRERKEKYYQKGDQLVFHFIKRRTRKMLYLSHTRGTSLDYATRYKKVGR